MTKLSPCPLCGGEPIDKHHEGWSWIECEKCKLQGPAERLGHGGNHDKAWEGMCFKLTPTSMYMKDKKKREGKNNDNK